MKKVLKVIISLFLVIIISFSFSATAFAYEYGSFDIQSMIKIEKDGYKEMRSINSKDVKRIKDTKSYMYRNLSDSEKLNLIFRELGYNMNALQIQKISEKISLSQIGNIHTEKTYIEVDEKGKQKNISKDEALKSAELKNKALTELKTESDQRTMTLSETSPTTSHGNEVPNIDPDNYMAQTVFVVYTPNYNGKGTTPGRYVAITTFEWLTVPFVHGTDCMGMYTNQFNWVDRIPGDDSNYFFISTYHKVIYGENGNIISSEQKNDVLEEDDAIISNIGGFGFKYNLKSNFLHIQYEGFSFIIFGVCRVKNYNDPHLSLSISSEYVHIQNPAPIGLSFSIGPVGIDVSGLLPNKKSFKGSHEWDYINDYYV